MPANLLSREGQGVKFQIKGKVRLPGKEEDTNLGIRCKGIQARRQG